ncbi:transposase [Weissella sagaensis]|uniref:transposase n=1 Tax=Weissella sagaensis TaxID=2559928 RepID=UPI0013ED030D|nr:transposase [Weissella sagaensis]
MPNTRIGAICVDEVLYAKHHYGFKMINGTTRDLFPNRTSIDIRRYLSNYDLSNRQHVQYVVTDINDNYEAISPNAQIIIDRFLIIQLAMKAVQSTRITLQLTINDKRSRVYKLLKSNWEFFITDRSKIDTTQPR